MAMWESKDQGWRSIVLWVHKKPAHESFPIPGPLLRLKDRILSWLRARISKHGIGEQNLIFAQIELERNLS